MPMRLEDTSTKMRLLDRCSFRLVVRRAELNQERHLGRTEPESKILPEIAKKATAKRSSSDLIQFLKVFYE